MKFPNLNQKMKCPDCGLGEPWLKTIQDFAYCNCGWRGQVPGEFMVGQKVKRYVSLAVALGLIALASSYVKKELDIAEAKRKDVAERAKIGKPAEDGKEAEWEEFGVRSMREARFADAESAYARVISMNPKNEKAYRELGQAQMRQSQFTKAEATFKGVMDRGFKDQGIMVSYAKALTGLKRDTDAKTWLYRAVKEDPSNADAVNELLNLLEKKQAYAEALSVIATVTTASPESKEVFEARKAGLDAHLLKQAATAPVKGKKSTIRVASLQKNAYLPVRFGDSKSHSLFLVDKNADVVTLSRAFVKANGLKGYKSLGKVNLKWPNGKTQKGEIVSFKKLFVGPWKVENVQVAICDGCALKVGKAVLKKFQTATEAVEGVNFLELAR